MDDTVDNILDKLTSLVKVNVENMEEEGLGKDLLDTTANALNKITDSAINDKLTVKKVTVDKVVKIANDININTSPDTMKEQEEKHQTASKIIKSVEKLIARVSLDENTQFTSKTESISVAVIKPKTEVRDDNCMWASFIDGDISITSCTAQTSAESSISIKAGMVPANQNVWFTRFAITSSLFASNSRPSWEINSEIVGAGIGKERQEFVEGERVQIKVRTYENLNDKNALCQFWDMSRATVGWSSKGMTLIEKTDSYVMCESSHLTNFAVLLNPADTIFTGYELLTLQIITIAGCTLSIIGLLATIVGLSVFKQFRKKLANKIHIGLALSLLLSYMSLLIGLQQTRYEGSCYLFSILIHYFFLCAFCWMLSEGVNLYLCLVLVFNFQSKLFLKYSLFSTRWFFSKLFLEISVKGS